MQTGSQIHIIAAIAEAVGRTISGARGGARELSLLSGGSYYLAFNGARFQTIGLNPRLLLGYTRPCLPYGSD